MKRAMAICIDCDQRHDRDERCEGCEMAVCPTCVRHDIDGIPLCKGCMKELIDSSDKTA